MSYLTYKRNLRRKPLQLLCILTLRLNFHPRTHIAVVKPPKKYLLRKPRVMFWWVSISRISYLPALQDCPLGETVSGSFRKVRNTMILCYKLLDSAWCYHLDRDLVLVSRLTS